MEEENYWTNEFCKKCGSRLLAVPSSKHQGDTVYCPECKSYPEEM